MGKRICVNISIRPTYGQIPVRLRIPRKVQTKNKGLIDMYYVQERKKRKPGGGDGLEASVLHGVHEAAKTSSW